MRRRVLAAALVAALFSGVLPAAVDAAGGPLTPRGVHVTLGAGTVTVAWSQFTKSGVTYSVSSTPSGLSCAVLDEGSCTFRVLNADPYRFRVTATVDGQSSPPSTPTAAYPRRVLLVVAGQSNAEGAFSEAVNPKTGVNYLRPPYTSATDYLSKITWMPWYVRAASTTRPISLDSPQWAEVNASGDLSWIFGPEIGLARELWTLRHQPVTIVKAAMGGSSLQYAWRPSRPGGLFSSMVGKVLNTMRTDGAAGQFDVLSGFYWYQGESDAEGGGGPGYRTRLTQFIFAARSRLPFATHAPFAIAMESIADQVALLKSVGKCAKLHCNGWAAGSAQVRAADLWARDHLANVVVVDTQGLPRVADRVHLSDIAELRLGTELARATAKDLG